MKKGTAAVKFPLLDGNDPFDLSKTKSDINLEGEEHDELRLSRCCRALE